MTKRDGMPEWVYWGLWGIKTRRAAMAFFWSCLIAGLVLMPLVLVHIRAVIMTGAALLAALYYLASIKCVDRNSHWE